MHKQQPFSLLFLFTLLSILSTIAANPSFPKHSKSTSNFIWSACRITQYPALCYHSLSGFANKIQQSERHLTLTALAVSLSRARSAASYVAIVSKTKGIKLREFEAVKDCIHTMSDSVDQLRRSFKELGHMRGHMNGEDFMWHISNVQTWVSAALTDENTCMDGFSEHIMKGHVKAVVKIRLTNVAQVTSNALALINRFASKHKD